MSEVRYVDRRHKEIQEILLKIKENYLLWNFILEVLIRLFLLLLFIKKYITSWFKVMIL